MAEIYSMVYKPEDNGTARRYARVPLERATLIVGRGIEDDLSGKGNPNRQLNVMSYETLAALGEEGFQTQPGEMGEQIVVRGLDVNMLPSGARVQLGESVVIEVIKLRTGCERFEAIQGRPREDAAGRLGVMARVIAPGVVQLGDQVSVLESVNEA